MRNKKAKKIRKMVYGDFSQREERVYMRLMPTGKIVNHKKTRRHEYQQLKKLVKEKGLRI